MKRKLFLFISIPILQLTLLVIFLFLFPGNNVVRMGTTAIFILFSFLVDWSLWHFDRQVEENKLLEQQIEELNNVRQKEMDYGKISIKHIEDMEKICEKLEKELKDNAATLNDQNGNPRKKAAAEIIENMEKMLYESRFKRYCQNDVVNALLDAKSREAERKDILLQVECRVPADLNRDEIETCGLFENMIDASLYLAGKVQKEEKSVSFKANEKSGMIVIKATMDVKNSEYLEQANSEKQKQTIRKRLWGPELELAERICRNCKGSFRMVIEEGELQIIAVV